MAMCKLIDYLDGALVPCLPVEIQGKVIEYIDIDPDNWYECWQPDNLDHEEFNLVILIKGFPCVVNSIDFDFDNEIPYL